MNKNNDKSNAINIKTLKIKSYFLTIIYLLGFSGFLIFKSNSLKLIDFVITIIIFVFLMNMRNKILLLELKNTWQEIAKPIDEKE